MDRFKRKPAPPSPATGFSSHSRLRSAQATPGYELVRRLLLAHVSPVLVESVLGRALSARRLVAESLTLPELAEVVSDAMVGLRLFVPEQRLAQLMLDLAELLELR